MMNGQLYRYKIITDQGTTLHGIIQTTADQAFSTHQNHILKMRKLTFIEAILFKPRISDQDLLNVTLQWGYLLKAGVSLIDILEVISKTQRSVFIQSTFARVLIQLQEGQKLSQALKAHPFLFDALYCHTVQVGEQQGKLSESFEKLVLHLQNRIEVKEKFKKATFYPLLLMTILILLLFSLGYFVLPKLKDFMTTIGSELPPSTRFLLCLGEYMENYALVFLTLLGTLCIGLGGVYIFTDRIAQGLDKLVIKIPIIGDLSILYSLSNYLTHFKILCDDGRSVVQALKESPQIVQNRYIKSQLQNISVDIEEGSTLTNAFSRLIWMPRLILKMIKVGESSGKLSHAVGLAEEYVHKDLWGRLEKYVRMLEPAFLLIAGCFFLWIVIAVFVPLYDQIGTIQ